MKTKLTESFNDSQLKEKLISKIREFIENETTEFATSQFHIDNSSFSLYADNGNGNIMKRFVIRIEDQEAKAKTINQQEQ
jgi:hypothetical protein